MSKRAGIVLFLLLAAAFFAVNRGAYRGYFQDDELDNISWAPQLTVWDYVRGAISPRFQTNNFRPFGHYYFHAAEQAFGLDFPRYVLVVHLIHLLNVWLAYLLARRLGAKPWAAASACVFFAFHMALFDAVWKPMYVFDVLCATFSLACLLFWSARRYVLSFVAFWLAYKSKELAVMLPVALACYEYWFGKRQWLRLAPFFAVSLSFGLQGLLLNPNRDNEYSFRFTAAALKSTTLFYAGRVFLVPLLGFALLVAAGVARNRRTWFGLAMMAAFSAPLLLLPGRLFSAYCYVPFTGLAVAFAGLAEAANPSAVAAFLLLWAPVDYRELRTRARETLSAGTQARAWVSTAAGLANRSPRPSGVVYAGMPAGFHSWGIEGAIHYLLGREAAVHAAESPEGAELLRSGGAPLLSWDPVRKNLAIVANPAAEQTSYIDVTDPAPAGQLVEGWYALEGDYRWVAPVSVTRLRRPDDATELILRVNVGTELLKDAGRVTVRPTLDGVELETRRFDQPGWREARWPLAAAQAGTVYLRLEVEPGFRPPGDARLLGIAVGALGFK